MQRCRRHNWTEVMLLGNSLEQDTAAKPLASVPTTEKSFIANTLYRRFYRLPEGVKLRLDSVYHRFDNTRTFTALGDRYVANVIRLAGSGGAVLIVPVSECSGNLQARRRDK